MKIYPIKNLIDKPLIPIHFFFEKIFFFQFLKFRDLDNFNSF